MTWKALLFLHLVFTIINLCGVQASAINRRFEIDYKGNQFLKDGEPFRFISGSIHYFRVHQEDWGDRLSKIRYAGLNAIQTYVEWSSHEPEPGLYDFTQNLDLQRFLMTAQEMDLFVILRIGPYICAERDMGGLPYWLLRDFPDIRLRTSDEDYLGSVKRWFMEGLLPVIKSMLYQNGGPIIALHLENEYGNSGECDLVYTSALRDLVQEYLGTDIVLLTTDNARINALRCGKIPGVYATVDFGPEANVLKAFTTQRLVEPQGPLVNSEFYTGWLDHWGEPRHKKSAQEIVTTLDKMLSMGASVNFYMFHGGTNYALSAGSNSDPFFRGNPTTYDYDAPLDERGDPTEKYFMIRNVTTKYVPPKGNITISYPQIYGDVYCHEFSSIFNFIHKLPSYVSIYPKTFEEMSLPSGVTFYQTMIPYNLRDPSKLKVDGLHDRAYIFINKEYVGVLAREIDVQEITINANKADELILLVEGEGRISVGPYLKDYKGLKKIYINDREILNWHMTPIDFSNYTKIEKYLYLGMDLSSTQNTTRAVYCETTFNITGEPKDTYIDTNGWGKGYIYINGWNLGRYWPGMGPQRTLYVPHGVLRQEINKLLIIELQEVPKTCKRQQDTNKMNDCKLSFVDKPNIDSPVPL